MYKNILVPTDGSPSALRAAALAKKFLLAGVTEKVALVHVTSLSKELGLKSRLMPVAVNEKLVQLVEGAGREIMEKTRAIFTDDGLEVECLVEFGEPAEAIVRLARCRHFELIIMGSRGLNKIKEILMGSISDQVIRLAKCPVMIVK